MHIWGDIKLTINSQPSTPVVIPQGDGKPNIYITRVRETDWHGANVMTDGGAFLSIQHWRNGVAPSSVGLDWEGTPVSSEQRALQEQESTKT